MRIILLVLVLIGCGSDDDNSLFGLGQQDETSIIGEWEIQSVDGEEVVRQTGDVRITGYGFDFYEDGRVWWFLFQESERGSSSSTIWGTYVINGSKIVVTLIEDDGDDFSFSADFEIKGNTLTLKSDTGEVLVLKKSLED